MRTQAELEITADVRGIKSMARALKDALTGGASDATKLRREIENTDRATAELAKTTRKLTNELRGVKAGSAEYKEMRGQIEAADRAMRSLRSEAARLKDVQRTAGDDSRENEARRHRNEARARAVATSLTSIGTTSPLAPYSAMAGALGAAGNAMTALPVIGTPLAIAAGVGAAGMGIRQQRMDRYLQWRSAMAGSAPHIAKEGRGWGFGAGYGLSPEQAMATASGFTSATGGQWLAGKGALDLSTRGFGPGAAGIGALFAPGGMARSAGNMDNAGRGDVIRNVVNAAVGSAKQGVAMFGGTINPQMVEKYLADIASATGAMADKGVDIDPQAVAGMQAAWTRAGYSVGGRAGVSKQVFAGQRGMALGSALSGMVSGEGAGGVLGLLSTGFGTAGGPSLADAMSMAGNGVGPAANQVSPVALTRMIQSMFGRGGAQRDLTDVVVGRGLGLSGQQFAALRRVDPGAMMGGAPTGDVLGMEQFKAQPGIVGSIDRQTIAAGAKYFGKDDLAPFMQSLFDVQTAMADFAGGIIDITKKMVDMAVKAKAELDRRLGPGGTSVPGLPGGR